jgi:hypothetical protein
MFPDSNLTTFFKQALSSTEKEVLVTYFVAASPYSFAELTRGIKGSTIIVGIPSGLERVTALIKVRIVEYFNKLAWSPILLSFQSLITSVQLL